MNEILIIENNFSEVKLLNDFFLKKNTESKIINTENLGKFESDKSTLICSMSYNEKVGGKSEILKISSLFSDRTPVVLIIALIMSASMIGWSI